MLLSAYGTRRWLSQSCVFVKAHQTLLCLVSNRAHSASQWFQSCWSGFLISKVHVATTKYAFNSTEPLFPIGLIRCAWIRLLISWCCPIAGISTLSGDCLEWVLLSILAFFQCYPAFVGSCQISRPHRIFHILLKLLTLFVLLVFVYQFVHFTAKFTQFWLSFHFVYKINYFLTWNLKILHIWTQFFNYFDQQTVILNIFTQMLNPCFCHLLPNAVELPNVRSWERPQHFGRLRLWVISGWKLALEKIHIHHNPHQLNTIIGFSAQIFQKNIDTIPKISKNDIWKYNFNIFRNRHISQIIKFIRPIITI